MTVIQDQVNALIAKVQAENTVIGSAMALITGLKAEIVSLQSASSPPTSVDLSALSAAIDAGAAQLAAAVAANTPTATVTVPVTVTVATPAVTVTSTSS